MTDLKLGRLPDRMPVKIAIAVNPDLNRALHLYADLYRETYGQAESVPALIPYMLQSFLENDRAFTKTLRERETSGDFASTPTATQAAEKSRHARLRGPSSTET